MTTLQFAQSFNDLESVTREMLRLEETLNREQSYIAKFGEANDADSDTAWEGYKETAQLNLDNWDALKAHRDTLKAAPDPVTETPNTYTKFCPNVYVAKCEGEHEKGDEITLTTKYGKENESIVFNHLGKTRDGFNLYSIVRADGFNTQEHAARKAEKLNNAASNAQSKSDERWDASNEGADFLVLAEPIKIGHHSEKRHRALIERNHNRMAKSVELSKKADSYESRAEYWEARASIINLSMPESIGYYTHKLEKATKYHAGLKDGIIERSHSFSLTYANKEKKETAKKLETAKRLWG